MLKFNTIHCGDCQTAMRDIDSDSVDCIVTDPPYGLSFMGKDWDKAVPSIAIWQECLRVLKPGAFAFVMCIPRQDCLARMICRLEDAGFKVSFSSIYHTFASGFPKAASLSKQADKRGGVSISWFGEWLKEWRTKKDITQKEIAKLFLSKTGGLTGCVANWELGLNIPTPIQFTKICRYFDLPFESIEEAKREVTGYGRNYSINTRSYHPNQTNTLEYEEKRKPATSQAKALDGAYAGFQPKPAVEVIIVAMKPLEEKTYIDQAMANMHGLTGLYDCRIPMTADNEPRKKWDEPSAQKSYTVHSDMQVIPGKRLTSPTAEYAQKGRFPANVLCEDDVLDDGRITKSTDSLRNNKARTPNMNYGYYNSTTTFGYGDKGSYSRYFSLDAWFADRIKLLPQEAQKTFPWLLVPKATKSEKDRGLIGESNIHPTCKSIKLMSWLITLASREGDIVLDPFCGSGTTPIAAKMLGRQYIGIEREEDYCEIACKRVAAIPTNLSRY